MKKLAWVLGVAACGGSSGGGESESEGEGECDTDADCPAGETCVAGECRAGAESEGEGVGDIEVDPPDELDFGNPLLGIGVTRAATITNVGDGDLRVFTLLLDEDDGTEEYAQGEASKAPPVTLGPGESMTVDVVLTIVDAEEDHGTLFVNTDDEDEAGYPLALVSELKGDPVANADPNPVDFGEVGVPETLDRDVAIYNVGDGNRPLELESAEVVASATGAFAAELLDAELPAFLAPPDEKTGVLAAPVIVRVTLDTTDLTEFPTASLVLTFATETLSVPIVGSIVACAVDGMACDDGLFCTDGDSCLGGSCAPGPARDCPSGVCSVGTCDEGDDTCIVSFVADGTVCPGGICVGGGCGASVCGDGYVDAAAGEECEPPSSGSCDAACHIESGGGCTSDTECPADGPCWDSWCDEPSGTCVLTTFSDGTVCGPGEICLAGACDPSICGDGFVDASAGEQCEPPGVAGCDASCLLPCDPDGAWTIATGGPIDYECCTPFGSPLVNIYITSFIFASDGASISPSPSGPGCSTALLGAATTCPAGSFDNDCTYAGGCTEYYVLTGSFTSADTWSGTFTIDFTGSDCSCFGSSPCTDQVYSITASR